ncbi:MAG: ABC transporter permease [Polyangiaceae bacterium]|nr:ABC transporter permease [Polyangiaceae bacterium]
MLPRPLIQLLAVAKKETLQTVNDRRMVALLMIAPALQLGILGAAVDFDVDRVATVVVDHDRSAASRHHIEHVLADGTLRRAFDTTSDAEALAAIDQGRAVAAVIVPPGFGERLERGEPAEIQFVAAGTDPNQSAVATAAAGRYARFESARLVAAARSARGTPTAGGPSTGSVRQAPGPVVLVPRVLHNPRLRTAVYMVPGVMALLLAVVTLIIAAMGLARERETGTLEQVMVTPIGATTLLAGKLLPYLVAGLFDLLMALVVAAFAFGVPINGNLGVVFLGTAAYLTSTLGTGLLVSTLSRTQQQAFIGGFLCMLPALLLSGVMTPLWGIPEWLRPLTYVNPVCYYAVIVRGVLIKGATLSELWFELLALAGIGVTVLAFAAWRFRRGLG